MADSSVLEFDYGVLLRFARLDVLQPNVTSGGPYLQRDTNFFRTVVLPSTQWLATPFDDPLQCANKRRMPPMTSIP